MGQQFAKRRRRRRGCTCCCSKWGCCFKKGHSWKKFQKCCSGEEEVVLFQHENATITQLPNDLNQLLDVQNDQTSYPESLLQGSTSETGGDSQFGRAGWSCG